jgi:hypothetical protein
MKKVCKVCGSDNVVMDAWVKWNPEKDDWEIDSVHDTAFCYDCEGETIIVDVDDTERPKTT